MSSGPTLEALLAVRVQIAFRTPGAVSSGGSGRLNPGETNWDIIASSGGLSNIGPPIHKDGVSLHGLGLHLGLVGLGPGLSWWVLTNSQEGFIVPFKLIQGIKRCFHRGCGTREHLVTSYLLLNHLVLDEFNTGMGETSEGILGEIRLLSAVHKVELDLLDLLDGFHIEQGDVFSRELEDAHASEFSLQAIHFASTWAIQVMDHYEKHH